ncbi:MAG: hypothetical protein K0Q73_5612 [Paenibacillus sp.]|nr:hypothetical protein [Paenibacillus sp.]
MFRRPVCYNEAKGKSALTVIASTILTIHSLSAGEKDMNEIVNLLRYKDQYSMVEDSRFPFKVGHYNRSESNNALHSHDYFQIVYVRKGAVRHDAYWQSRVSVKGDIYLIPPYISHYLEPIYPGTEVVQIDFVPILLLNGSEWPGKVPFIDASHECSNGDLDIALWMNLPIEKQILLEQTIDNLWREWSSRLEGYDVIIRLELYKMMFLLDREFKSSQALKISLPPAYRYNDGIEDAARYIQLHFSEKLSLELLASVACMSPAHFSHKFKQAKGKTVIEYLNEQRIRHAMGLMKESTLSIMQICFECGYNHQGHFGNMFKKVTGLAPKAYRELLE